MKIGIFDSGLGGLMIAKHIVRALPAYDFIYLGDTERAPYGNRSPQVVYAFLQEAVEFLFSKDCALVIVACNTASAQALRRIQREYLPRHHPARRVLGVLVPTVEAVVASGAHRVGVLATAGTVATGAFTRELKKAAPAAKVWERAAPLLVPMIELDELAHVDAVLARYLSPLLAKHIDTLILGCTHYPLVARRIRKLVGPNVRVVAQTDLIGGKLFRYLARHPEIERTLSRRGKVALLVTDLTPTFAALARRWFGPGAKPKVVQYY